MRKIFSILCFISLVCSSMIVSCSGEQKSAVKASNAKDSTMVENVVDSILFDSVVVEEYDKSKDSIIVSVTQAKLIDTTYEQLIKKRVIPVLVKNKSSENFFIMRLSSPKHFDYLSFYIDKYIGTISNIKKRVLCCIDIDGYYFLVCDDLNLSTEQKKSLFEPTSQKRSFVLGKEPMIQKDGSPECVYSIDKELKILDIIYEVDSW